MCVFLLSKVPTFNVIAISVAIFSCRFQLQTWMRFTYAADDCRVCWKQDYIHLSVNGCTGEVLIAAPLANHNLAAGLSSHSQKPYTAAAAPSYTRMAGGVAGCL